MVFDRTPAGGAEFGVSGILFQSNLVMYDRNTDESLWPQMMAQARCGPEQGTRLPLFPSIEMRWAGWVSLYPGTRVWGSPPEDRKGYAPKEVVLGVGGEGGTAWAFPFSSLEGLGPMAAIARSFGTTQGGDGVGPCSSGRVGIQP